MSRKVVITGLGTVNPLGMNVGESWRNLVEGKSGVRTLTQPWVSEYSLPTTFAACLPTSATELLTAAELNRLDPVSQYAVLAAREAARDCGDLALASERIGVSMGTGIGGVTTLLDSWTQMSVKRARRLMPMTVPKLMANAAAVAVGMALEARGPTQTFVSACASSTEAMVHAFRLIKSGEVDAVYVGGAEAALHPLCISAFSALRALSRRNDEPQKASRPFEADRDGFVMAEGSAVLVLETEENARLRGAKIYAELAGGSINSDAHHITAPSPEGLQASQCMEKALKLANISPKDINHINAHATSTPIGDSTEYKSLKRLFGSHLDKICISATKSSTGHLLGGAGALEALFTVKAIEDRLLPPTLNYDRPDPQIPVNLTPVAKKLNEPIRALSNSFGFGGHNAVVVLLPADS